MLAQLLLRWPLRASLLWLPIGLAATLLTPELFVQFPEVVHLIIPAVTAALIAANLLGSILILARTGQALRALASTLVQLPLFSLLFFQIAHHLGPSHFHFDHSPRLQDWLVFTGAHALRAADLFDFLEAYDIHFQSIRHASGLTSGCLVAFHLVIDLFLLRCLLTWFLRDSKRASGIATGVPGLVATVGGGVMWLILHALVLGGFLAWWWGGNVLTASALEGISLGSRVYVLGMAALIVVGWDLYARAHGRWSFWAWCRRGGCLQLGALLALQLALIFLSPYLATEGAGLTAALTGLVFLASGLVVVASGVGGRWLEWSYLPEGVMNTALVFLGSSLLFPLVVLANTGVSSVWHRAEWLAGDGLPVLVGLLVQFSFLAVSLPLTEALGVRLLRPALQALRRVHETRQPYRYGGEPYTVPAPFGGQPWAVPFGWLCLFAALTPVWWWAATSYSHWRPRDMAWWPMDNLLRVFDFVDVMQIYHLHLAVTPRDVWLGTLTFLCRVLMALALMGLFGSLLRWVSLRCLGGFGMTEVDLKHYLAAGDARSEWVQGRARKRLEVVTSNPVTDQQVMHTLGIAALVVGLSFGVVVLCEEKGWPAWSTRAAELGKVVEGGKPGEAEAAMAEVRRLGRYAEPAVPFLAAKARAGDAAAVSALGEIGGPEARKVLCECLTHRSVGVEAARSLGRCGRSAVPELLCGFHSESPEVKAVAAARIREIGRDAAPFVIGDRASRSPAEMLALASELDPYCLDMPEGEDFAEWVRSKREEGKTPPPQPEPPLPPPPPPPPEWKEPSPPPPPPPPVAVDTAAREYEDLLAKVQGLRDKAAKRMPRSGPESADVRLRRIDGYLAALRVERERAPNAPVDPAHVNALKEWVTWFGSHERLYEAIEASDRAAVRGGAFGAGISSTSKAVVRACRNALWSVAVGADQARDLADRVRAASGGPQSR